MLHLFLLFTHPETKLIWINLYKFTFYQIVLCTPSCSSSFWYENTIITISKHSDTYFIPYSFIVLVVSKTKIPTKWFIDWTLNTLQISHFRICFRKIGLCKLEALVILFWDGQLKFKNAVVSAPWWCSAEKADILSNLSLVPYLISKTYM